MSGIYTVSIIFLLFIIYNYLYAYEGFESASYTSSINSLLTGNKWVNPQTFDNNVTINADIVVKSDKKICIGDTCVTKEELQLMKDITSGNKNIYIYKANDWNKYLYAPNSGAEMRYGDSNDSDDTKKGNGSWRISSVIPKEQLKCGSYSLDCSF